MHSVESSRFFCHSDFTQTYQNVFVDMEYSCNDNPILSQTFIPITVYLKGVAKYIGSLTDFGNTHANC